MSCCGSQRASLRYEPAFAVGGESRHAAWGAVEFEYSGQGQLTVVGPLTGLVYRFTSNGARVRVEGSDAPSLLSVPGLRPVT